MLDRPIFNEAFEPNFKITISKQAYRFGTQVGGHIDIRSGKLAAFDPLVEFEAEPFEKQFPLGSFPLHLAIAGTGEDERIALAKIVFSSERIARWELALVKGQDPSTLKKGEFFGYAVDSGTGSFMDEKAMRAYASRRQREGEEFDDFLINEMEKTYAHTRSWLMFSTDQGKVALFSTGYGDGSYPSYYAYSDQGKLVALITDFGVVPWQ